MEDSEKYNIVKEFLSTPTSEQPFINLDGTELYTSEKLKGKLKDLLLKSSYPNIAKLKMIKLIDDTILAPVYASKSMIHLIFNKMLKKWFSKHLTPSNLDYMIAAVIKTNKPENDKIILLIENTSTYLFYNEDDLIYSNLTHEMMHYIYDRHIIKMTKLFESSLCNYYFNFYSQLCKDDNDINFDIVRNQENLKTLIYGMAKSNKQYDCVKNHKEYISTILPDNEKALMLSKTIDKYIRLVLFGSFNSLSSAINSHHDILNVYISLTGSYKTTFGINTDAFVAQELFNISEVMSITAEKPSPMHFHAFNFLK